MILRGDRRAAFGACRGILGGAAQVVATLRAQAALDASPSSQRERPSEQQPQDQRIEHRVDREAGPERTKWQHVTQ